ncbi:circadian clock protein KaiA [Pannus brasiliensis CCIBt3594]|uniref:Circadian clock oscillator protein KaiA n=1 Tax=Pannus brasiliensis CCIBt3594 TaxID=1427578 RepID=A0AAW9QW06_9CHRO
MSLRLTIYAFVPVDPIARSLRAFLGDERYHLTLVGSSKELLDSIEEHKEKIDCLVVLQRGDLQPALNSLYESGLLLPVVMIRPGAEPLPAAGESPTCLYHSAEIVIPEEKLEEIAETIDRAIARFLHLAPTCSLSDHPAIVSKPDLAENKQSFLLLQQRRLAEKLKERLGYLGVYYKRNPEYFYRNLPPIEREEVIDRLREMYQEIILNYFAQDYPINQAIDEFVNQVFFIDLSVSRILEIHMDLMDRFSQQLKLEGRSEEILLDYRLALIDILAHLGEMYRRSIPREDIPYDLLFGLD